MVKFKKGDGSEIHRETAKSDDLLAFLNQMDIEKLDTKKTYLRTRYIGILKKHHPKMPVHYSLYETILKEFSKQKTGFTFQ